MWKLEDCANGFTLTLDGKTLLRHCAGESALFAGRGEERIEMYRGNFDITDRVSERFALHYAGAERDGGSCVLRFDHPCLTGELRVEITERDGMLFLCGAAADETVNRIYLRLPAEEGEHVMGGGEQFSCLDLRGKLFPIWTREQGVGRNKLTEITRLAELNDRAGGDYHTTFFPQPTFVSSRLYFAHLSRPLSPPGCTLRICKTMNMPSWTFATGAFTSSRCGRSASRLCSARARATAKCSKS